MKFGPEQRLAANRDKARWFGIRMAAIFVALSDSTIPAARREVAEVSGGRGVWDCDGRRSYRKAKAIKSAKLAAMGTSAT